MLSYYFNSRRTTYILCNKIFEYSSKRSFIVNRVAANVGATQINTTQRPTPKLPNTLPPYQPPITFVNGFSNKRLNELLLSFATLSALQVPGLIRNASKILSIAKTIVGDRLTHYLLKISIFKQFCAGETLDAALEKATLLSVDGIGSIFDYVVETELGDENADTTHPSYIKTVGIIKQLADVTGVNNKSGIAIKLSGIMPPSDLDAASKALLYIHNVYADLIGSSAAANGYIMTKCCSLKNLDRESFKRRASQFFEESMDLDFIFDSIASRRIKHHSTDIITYFQWMQFFSLDTFINVKAILCNAKCPIKWTEANSLRWQIGKHRCIEIFEIIDNNNSFAFIDAEPSFLQLAIDQMAWELQMIFNKDKCIVYNTYQAYRKDALNRVTTDLQKAQLYRLQFGVKLVRGAYMEMERRTANSKQSVDPIHATLTETERAFDSITELLLSDLKHCNVFLATHNGESITKAVSLLQRKGIDPAFAPVHFAQLLGLSDQITASLSNFGFRAYKYIPYGPVEHAIPFLIRRAEENAEAVGGSRNERQIIINEIKNRLSAKFM